jgi:hypothetical protein
MHTHTHTHILGHRPYKASSMAGKAEAATAPSAAAGGSAGGQAGNAGSGELLVEEVYRPGRCVCVH